MQTLSVCIWNVETENKLHELQNATKTSQTAGTGGGYEKEVSLMKKKSAENGKKLKRKLFKNLH